MNIREYLKEEISKFHSETNGIECDDAGAAYDDGQDLGYSPKA